MTSNPVFLRAIIRVTSRCNLGCPECFLRQLPRSRDLSLDDYLRIQDRCLGLGLRFDELTFTGGEPTLWPDLANAVMEAKLSGLAKRVIVGSNAALESIDIVDYGPADRINITIYGAQNWYNIIKLKKQGGSRVKANWVVHVPSKIQATGCNTLPAKCSCACLSFSADKVFPCTMARQQEVNGFPLNSDFMTELNRLDIYNQDICRSCFANQKCRPERVYVPLSAAWGIVKQSMWRIWYKLKGLKSKP